MKLEFNYYLKKILILFIGIFFVGISIPCYGFEHNEKISIKRNVQQVAFSSEIDYRYDGDNNFRRHYDIGVRVPLSFLGHGWSAGTNFRMIYKKTRDGDWNLEKRPHGTIQKTFKTPALKWLPELKWTLRSRQEYRIKENGSYTTSNRIRYKVKSEKEYFKVKPFFGHEIFYDFDLKDFSKNRITLGIQLPEIKGTTPSIYYRFVTDLDDEPVHTLSSLVFKLGF
jgi:hypothetical protein